MEKVVLPETDEMRALREEIAAIEAALARMPPSVRDQVAIAAQQPQRYGFREFVAYMRSWMTARNLLQYAQLAAFLYGVYVADYNANHTVEEDPSGGGGWLGGGGWNFTPQMAPADGSGSVVDAVFAKADKAGEKRAHAPMRA